jgi:methyl-accepting chemotaxis protein/hemerythrin
MAIEWTQSLSVGIPEIDDQHREFIRLLMELDKAVHEGTAGERVGGVMAKLDEYVLFHFGTEERHFDEFGCYANSPAHKAAHKAFTDQLNEMKYRFLHDRELLSTELAQTMFDWLANHIAKMDREYIDCFKKSGL